MVLYLISLLQECDVNLHVHLSVPHTRMQLNKFVPPPPTRVVTSGTAPSPPGPLTESSDLVDSKQM
jgi:hypothetical protein